MYHQIKRQPVETIPAPQSAVGIVIVNFNSLQFTLDCLSSLTNLTYPNYFVIVIDNNSPDGSGYELQRRLRTSNVTIIINPENSGFAAGNNVGIRLAEVRGANYVWLLNADTIVDPNALSHLVSVAESHPDGAAFGSKVLYQQPAAEAKLQPLIWSAGGRVDFSRREVQMFGWHERDTGQHEQLRDCDYIPGCSFLFRLSLLNAVGYMPEEYFMYFEETDWCTTMREGGHKLYYIPESIVWHRFDDDKLQTPFGVYYYNRNQLYFWYKHSNLIQRLKMRLRVLFWDLPRIQRAVLVTVDPSMRQVLLAHRASFLDFLLGRLGKRFRPHAIAAVTIAP